MENKRISELLSTKTTKSKIILVVLFVVSTVFLFLPFLLDIDYRTFTTLGLIGLFIINFLGSATLFLPAPAILSAAIAAASFNPLLVAFVAAIASSLGEIVAFVFGYSSVHVLDLKRHKNIFRITKSLIHWRGGILIPLFAFVPNPFFDGLGILAGMSHFPLIRFLLYTFIGRFVRTIGIVYLGLFLWQ